MFSPGGISGMNENYEKIATKIYEYYDSEEEKGNKLFEKWTYEYSTKDGYNYDSMYEFIMDYPEFKDIVYFDPDKE